MTEHLLRAEPALPRPDLRPQAVHAYADLDPDQAVAHGWGPRWHLLGSHHHTLTLFGADTISSTFLLTDGTEWAGTWFGTQVHTYPGIPGRDDRAVAPVPLPWAQMEARDRHRRVTAARTAATLCGHGPTGLYDSVAATLAEAVVGNEIGHLMRLSALLLHLDPTAVPDPVASACPALAADLDGLRLMAALTAHDEKSLAYQLHMRGLLTPGGRR